MFDTSGDGVVDFAEFKDILVKLDVQMGDQKARELFAECDVSGSGTLNQDEFEAAWERLKELQVNGAMESMHMTQSDLVWVVVGLVFVLILVFIFIFLGVATLSGKSTLDAAVSSMMTAGAGLGSGGGGKKEGVDDEEQALADADAAAAE